MHRKAPSLLVISLPLSLLFACSGDESHPAGGADGGSSLNPATITTCGTEVCTSYSFCDTQAQKCVECITDTDCIEPFSPFCVKNSCGQCKVNSDCTAIPGKKLCDSNICIACKTTSDCGANKTCVDNEETDEKECASVCTTDTDCVGHPYGPFCGLSLLNIKQCVMCLKDTHCPKESPYCDEGYCVACRGNADCPTGTRCNGLECVAAGGFSASPAKIETSGFSKHPTTRVRRHTPVLPANEERRRIR